AVAAAEQVPVDEGGGVQLAAEETRGEGRGAPRERERGGERSRAEHPPSADPRGADGASRRPAESVLAHLITPSDRWPAAAPLPTGRLARRDALTVRGPGASPVLGARSGTGPHAPRPWAVDGARPLPVACVTTSTLHRCMQGRTGSPPHGGDPREPAAV